MCLPALAQSNSSPQNQSGQNDQNSKSDDGNFSAGINLGKNASSKDVGLPIYPGSRRHKDSDNDSSALNVGLWGGSSAFKMAILEMETNDSTDKVAAFYRKALAKYGKVLICAGPGAETNSAPPDADKKSKGPDPVRCDNDSSGNKDKSEIEFKSGTKDKQHVVGITPKDGLTTYSLVYIETRGLDDK